MSNNFSHMMMNTPVTIIQFFRNPHRWFVYNSESFVSNHPQFITTANLGVKEHNTFFFNLKFKIWHIQKLPIHIRNNFYESDFQFWPSKKCWGFFLIFYMDVLLKSAQNWVFPYVGPLYNFKNLHILHWNIRL